MDLITTDVLLGELREVIDARKESRVVQFINGNKIAQVSTDPEMRQIMSRADYVLADGQPLLPMGRMLGIRIPERIDGIGLMGRLLAFASEHGYSVFLLGAKQSVLDACMAKIVEKHPTIKIAGSRNGYFKAEESRDIAAEIRKTGADILFLGMGSPMKERFADQFAEATGVPVIQGVGGSFDVIAGCVKRAPVWLQRIGLEWIYRIVQEPRRMFWRYVKTNAQCMWMFMKALIGVYPRPVVSERVS